MRPITERLSPVIRNLVVAQAVLFFLYILAARLRLPIEAHLALGPLFAAGEVWQPATSLFVHLEWWSFAFDLIGLWFVGATIEHALGRKRFLLLFFGTGLVANLVVGLVMAGLRWPFPYFGCGDPVLALFVALGVIYGPAQVRVLGALALQARVLTGILIGFSVLVALSRADWPSLAGMLVAVCMGYFLSGGKWGALSGFFGRFRRRRRSVLEVLEGGRSKPGKKYVN